MYQVELRKILKAIQNSISVFLILISIKLFYDHLYLYLSKNVNFMQAIQGKVQFFLYEVHLINYTYLPAFLLMIIYYAMRSLPAYKNQAFFQLFIRMIFFTVTITSFFWFNIYVNNYYQKQAWTKKSIYERNAMASNWYFLIKPYPQKRPISVDYFWHRTVQTNNKQVLSLIKIMRQNILMNTMSIFVVFYIMGIFLILIRKFLYLRFINDTALMLFFTFLVIFIYK